MWAMSLATALLVWAGGAVIGGLAIGRVLRRMNSRRSYPGPDDMRQFSPRRDGAEPHVSPRRDDAEPRVSRRQAR